MVCAAARKIEYQRPRLCDCAQNYGGRLYASDASHRAARASSARIAGHRARHRQLRPMSISPDEIADTARRLHEAERSKTRLPLLSRAFPDMTMQDGYAIQSAWLEIKRAEGRKTIGYKIGLTSRAMQVNSQIDEPDYGSLLDDMLFAEGGDIPSDRFIRPLVEVELAF